MTTTTVTPKVCIQCLASYNAGRLVFEWVDATEGIEALEETREKVKQRAIAAAKEAGEWPVYFTEPEEFMLADWEGFGELVGEWTSLEKVAELADAIEEHGDPFLAYLTLGNEADNSTVWELTEAFQEAYCGEQTIKEYAEENAQMYLGSDLTAEQWSAIESYIDTEILERDLSMDYSEVTVEPSYTTYLFRTG